jgi:uncharacterized protein (DUF1697 family)
VDTIPHLALLRGVNVGGKNKLPMKDLASMFADAGCRDVRTYIQSGNVLFTAPPDLAAQVPALIARRITEAFGYRTPVILRTAEQLAAAVARNPFLAAGAPVETLHVLFLADAPTARRVASLDSDRSPPDAFRVHEREVYLHTPNGIARTKLTNAYFDAQLATTSTARNWRTVNALFALMSG